LSCACSFSINVAILSMVEYLKFSNSYWLLVVHLVNDQ
jgi:hypothetical protein